MTIKDEAPLGKQQGSEELRSSNSGNDSPLGEKVKHESTDEGADSAGIWPRIAALFDGHEQHHGTYKETSEGRDGKVEIKGSARTVREPVTLDYWCQHRDGIRPLGIVPIRLDNTAVFGAIDIDDHDIDLVELWKRIEKEKLDKYLVLCRSKSGGAHVYAFFDEGIPAAQVREGLAVFAAAIGFAYVEVFPKQSELDPWNFAAPKDSDCGNWINMPYFDSKETDRYAAKSNGLAMSDREFLDAAEAARMSADEFARQVARLKPKVEADAYHVDGEGQKTTSPATHADALARLEFRAKQVENAPAGEANIALAAAAFDLGRYVRDADLGASVAEARMLAAWRARKEDDPNDTEFRGVWDRQLRKGQSEGWPALKWNGKGLPYFERVCIEHDGEDTTWELQIDGQIVRVPAKDMLDWRKFSVHSLVQITQAFFVAKHGDWVAHINRAGASAEHVTPEKSTSISDVFFEHLEEFLTNRFASEYKEDVHLGRPWYADEEGRYYFRMRDFRKFLQSTNEFQISRESSKTIGRRIRLLGGNYSSKNISKKTVDLWWVPADLFSVPDEIPLPPLDGVPF